MRTLGFTAHSALRTHGRPWEALRAVDACGMGMQPWHTCGLAGVRAGVRAGDRVWWGAAHHASVEAVGWRCARSGVVDELGLHRSYRERLRRYTHSLEATCAVSCLQIPRGCAVTRIEKDGSDTVCLGIHSHREYSESEKRDQSETESSPALGRDS